MVSLRLVPSTSAKKSLFGHIKQRNKYPAIYLQTHFCAGHLAGGGLLHLGNAEQGLTISDFRIIAIC
jgi:hypothetical protein